MLELLVKILARSARPEAVAWLSEVLAQQSREFQQRPFYYAFSGVSRHFDKQAGIQPTESDLKELEREHPGFTLKDWDEFRLARVVLLLMLADHDKATFLENLKAILGSADIREQVAIYSAFPLLPYPEDLVSLAREGLRTNIVDVFDAIALDNEFPAKHFHDDAWNQMVLKALFISRPLYRIRGIDERANFTLAEALSNLAHERWAAGRPVSPELWRSCQKFLTGQIIEDVKRVADTDEPGQREAAALLVADHNGDRHFDDIRKQVKPLAEDVEAGRLTWDGLGRQLETSAS